MNGSNGKHRRLASRKYILLACAVAISMIAALTVYLGVRGSDGDSTVDSGADARGSEQGPAASSDPALSASPSVSASTGPSASASASKSPSAAAGGASGGWPNAANTGIPAGKKLVPSDAIRVTRPGTVIDGLDMRGDISVEADNVVIKNTRIVTAGTWGIIQRQNFKGLIVRDTEIHGNGKDQLQFAVFNLGGMITIERNEFSVVSDHISTSSGLIVDNYLHSPKFFPGDHIDVIQSNSGPKAGDQLVIRHNTIINTYDQTAAIALFQDFGVQHSALIENNLLAGGGYAIYGGAGAKGKSHNIRVVNNVFSRQVFPKSGHWGPVAYWDKDGPGNVWQSNVWDTTGEAVSP